MGAMSSSNARGDILRLSASMRALNAALVTKYSPEQRRGPDGRWINEGGGGSARRSNSSSGKGRSKRLADDADALGEAKREAKAAEAAENARKAQDAIDKATKAIEGIARGVNGAPKEVWAEKDWADAAYHALTNLNQWVFFAAQLTILPLAAIVGTAAILGAYRVARHIYRKLTIAGYQGMKPYPDLGPVLD